MVDVRAASGCGVLVLDWVLRRLLELIVLRMRSEREKEIAILVLRHRLHLLERQVARPQLGPADRALLAAFGCVLSEGRGCRSWSRRRLASGAGSAPLDVSASSPEPSSWGWSGLSGR